MVDTDTDKDERISPRRGVSRSDVLARNAIAATSHPLATKVAVGVLEQGGSAVDAAIAANAMLGLVEPTGCGIGGDLFAIVWDRDSAKLHGLNASGRSPKSLTLEHLRGLGLRAIPSSGPLSVSVPGCVDGWYTLHERFGVAPMKELLAPTIRYARDGFPVTEVIAEAWAFNAKALRQYPGFEDTFLPSGRAPNEGEVFRNPGLADTLSSIADGGRDCFYDGPIAESIGRFMKEAGGFLTASDLEEHRSEWVEPVSTTYRGLKIWELPPNTQGIAALQILNLLEGFDVATMGFGSADHIHHFVEAKKLAFEDRARHYADPEFADVPLAELISKDYAARRRKHIDPSRAALELPHADPVLRTSDTVYLTTADAAGNMVSLIQSNFRGMGSGLCPRGLGFGLQNRGELFSLEDGHPNCYAPSKRPFHTIIPGFATRSGQPVLSFGVMGGDAQPQMHAQIVMNLVDFGMGLQEAGDAPRILHTGSSDPTGYQMSDGGTLHLEAGLDTETLDELERRGHRIVPVGSGAFGGYQAIQHDASTGIYRAASESRKDGCAMGF
jgi:gamma-glutamyltranspeptidase/glutathione hydrolase